MSCSNSTSTIDFKYGIDFNIKRNEIGLPPLDSTWKYNKAIGTQGGSWINPYCENEHPCHIEKSILCNKDTIIWESNVYEGINYFTTVDGTFKETLYITYYFQDRRWKYVWEKGVPVNSNWDNLYHKEIDKIEADSLLINWEIL